MTTGARRALLALLLVLGAALRFWGIGFGLPNDLARPDEEKIIKAALVVAGGDLNPHLFLYPSLFIYAVAAAYSGLFALAGGAVSAASYASGAVADPTALHLVARVISATAGVVTIGVLYGAARELFGSRAAFLSAFLLSVAFLHVRDSHFGTTDAPVTLVASGAFSLAARCATRGASIGRVVLTGLLCGLATSTKYNAVLVAAPACIAVAGRPLLDRRLPTRREIGMAAILLVFLAAGYLVATPYTLLDRSGFMAQFSEQQRIFAGTQNGSIIGPARMALGGERGWVHYALFTLPHGVGLAICLAAVLGAAWLAREDWWRALLVLAFPLLYYASMGMGQLVYARNMVPAIPFVCLAAGFGVDRAAAAISRLARRESLATVLGVALALALAAPTAADSVSFDRLIARTDTRVQGARWIETHYPDGAAVFQTGVFYGHLQPVPKDRYPQAPFNERRGVFALAGGSPGLPDIIVRLDSPLPIYSAVPAGLESILERDYVLVQTFPARRQAASPGTDASQSGPSRAIYDLQDAWYVPYAGHSAVLRPGPDVFIYSKR